MLKNRRLEMKIEKAINNATPSVLDNILSQCTEQKGNVIYMKEEKSRLSFMKFASIAAVIVVMFGVILAGNYKLAVGVDSTVFLDVNPSIELSVNKNERILSANALNEDAEKILEGMSLKNTNLDVGINAIIGSMLKNGYLSDTSNSILVSVENENKEKSDKLKEHLANEISEILNVSSVDAAILSQSVKENPKVKELSEEYGVSKGKSELILTIIDKNPDLTIEKLAGLTINELNLIMSSNEIEIPEITSKGEPSIKSYITSEEAKRIALEAANINGLSIKSLKTSLDTEDGNLVYEVEFVTDNCKFEFKINAVDGSVCEHEMKEIEIKDKKEENKKNEDKKNDKKDDKKDDNTQLSIEAKISVEKVREIVLNAANLSGKKVGLVDIELEFQDGVLVYEADFHIGNDEYSYKVNANTGEIIEFDFEKKSIDNYGQNKKETADNTDEMDNKNKIDKDDIKEKIEKEIKEKKNKKNVPKSDSD